MDNDLTPMPMVLMYHSVEPYTRDPYQITVRPERFEQQMRWLRRRRLRGVSMRDLLAARRAGPSSSRRPEGIGRQRTAAGLVGLTFDDGYTDFVLHALPILNRYGFTATVFVVAGALGGTNTWDGPGPRKSLVTADDVVRMAAAGVEIGSHSMTHPRLPETELGDLVDEVRDSRKVLADLTGDEISGFCYPYGAVGPREVAIVREAGYDYACAVYPGELDGRLALPRTYIGDRDSSPRLLAKWARHRLRFAR
jgi:peptidoglycan/xylan/chitin deacetylase (PgdA/CDA1 family)